MAWNPSPEVQVVRDTAAAIGKTLNVSVDRCIVLFTTKAGTCGYVSYGETREKCAEAKEMAEAAAPEAWGQL